MTRWICPNCGSGKNAPERPRKNDVRRYCLKCSADTGLLVERTAPKLERQRAAAKTRTAERRRTKVAKLAAKHIVPTVDAAGHEHEVDVIRELHRALRAMGKFDGEWIGERPTMNDVEVNVRRRAGQYCTGRAVQRGFKITLTVPRVGCSHEELLELLYHEAAHCANAKADHHGPGFRRLLAVSLRDRWPFVRYGATDTGQCYDADRKVVDQMRNHVLNGGEL